jgi:hypothetical protein
LKSCVVKSSAVWAIERSLAKILKNVLNGRLLRKALVDFKYYKNKKGFPKQALEDLFYRTTAKGADVAFFIVSSSITPAITKWLDKYKKNINSRVRIKIWSGAEIETLVVKNPEFINNLDIRVTLMKPLILLKRIPVKLNYMPKKEENYTIIVHAQRTQNNEIFRVLLYALGPDNAWKTRYFVDRKLSLMDEETAQSLEVNSVKEWNNQPQTLTDIQFITRILDFLDNFKICRMPPLVITWGENVDWLSEILKKAPHLMEHPAKFEDYIEASFGQDLTKEQLVKTLQVKPDSLDMFYPAEIERKILGIIS